MNRTCLTLISALGLLFASSLAFGQSLSSSYRLSASNTGYADADGNLYSHDLVGGYDPYGGPIGITDYARSFSGYDAAGDSATMTFTGSAYASAAYKQLKARASGTLVGAYLNRDLNEPYYKSNVDEVNEDGSPDLLSAVASAQFSDTLTFGNFSTSYKIQYIFNFHGNLTGDSVYSDLYFGVGSYYKNISPLTFASRGDIAQIVATEKIAVSEGFQHSVSANLFVQFSPNVEQYTGRDAAGSVDFSATATLLGLYVTDADGHEVTDWTVTSASGTTYSAAPVPEPGTFAALALGGGALCLRRRRKA